MKGLWDGLCPRKGTGLSTDDTFTSAHRRGLSFLCPQCLAWLMLKGYLHREWNCAWVPGVHACVSACVSSHACAHTVLPHLRWRREQEVGLHHFCRDTPPLGTRERARQWALQPQALPGGQPLAAPRWQRACCVGTCSLVPWWCNLRGGKWRCHNPRFLITRWLWGSGKGRWKPQSRLPRSLPWPQVSRCQAPRKLSPHDTLSAPSDAPSLQAGPWGREEEGISAVTAPVLRAPATSGSPPHL